VEVITCIRHRVVKVVKSENKKDGMRNSVRKKDKNRAAIRCCGVYKIGEVVTGVGRQRKKQMDIDNRRKAVGL